MPRHDLAPTRILARCPGCHHEIRTFPAPDADEDRFIRHWVDPKARPGKRVRCGQSGAPTP